MPRQRTALAVAWLTLWLLAEAATLSAQQPPHWRFLTSSDGLRESWVLDVTPGLDGRWWITHGNVDALSVYDGYTIRQLPSPGATVAVREGPTGQAWALLPRPTALDVYDGLQLLEDRSWTRYAVSGLPTTAGTMRRWHFLPWAADRVLVLSPDALIEFDRSQRSQRILLKAKDTTLRTFTELIPAGNTGAWIGGVRGVARIDPPSTPGAQPRLTEHLLPDAFRDATVLRLHEANGGTLLASVQLPSTRALLAFDGRAWQEVTRLPAGSEDRIEGWAGLDGETWIARASSRSFGLEIVRGGQPAIQVDRTTALSGRLNSVQPAGDGTFWLATSLGLARHAPAAWRTPFELTALEGHVAALFESRRGDLYALHERSLLRRTGDRWQIIELPGSLRPDVTFTDNIAELPDGRILLGIYEGHGDQLAFDGPALPTFDPVSARFGTVRHPEARRLQLLAAGSPERVWMITGTGDDTRLETFDGRSFTTVFHAGRRWLSRPRSLVERSGGEVTIVADGTGVGRWHDGVYRVLGRAEGYPGSGPFCVLDVGDDRYWFGDRDSVIELAGGRWRTVRSGIQGVRSLTRSRDGTIWVASGSGLHAYRNRSWLTITSVDGLPAGGVYDVLETRDSTLWVSTTSGISRYFPEADVSSPESFLDDADNLRNVPPTGETHVKFRGLDRWNYTQPERLLYSWRLDGAQWSPLQAEGSALLTGLAAGRHTIDVRAVDRNWNVDPTPARFEFAVMLPWYRETGFLAVGTLALLGLGAAIGLFATRHLRLERLVGERTSALAESNRQLRRELVDRERMAQERTRLEAQLHQAQKLEAIGRLAGGIAHDFNNLLTVIWSYGELMRSQLSAESPLDTPAREIAKAAERAAALTRQLLAFGRQEMIRPDVLDLNQVIADIELMLAPLIGEEIDLECRPGAGLWSIRADRGRVEQVIVNLAINARDAMPDGGKLTIETSNVGLDAEYARTHVGAEPGPYVLLAVSDTGMGMDAETRARVFEPFFTTKERGRGTGLGLATVYGIVVQAGGHIWVYSEPGLGATFKVYLPRTLAEPSRAVAAAPAVVTTRGTETILLVEDDDALRTMAAEILRRSGFVALEAPTAEDAEKVMTREGDRIALVLSDIVLPGMSGPHLVDLLRETRPDLRVLFMSGYADDAVVRHGLLESEVAFIQKPFVPDALLRKVREALDAPTRRQGGAGP